MNQVAVTAIPLSIPNLIACAKEANVFVKFLPLIIFRNLQKLQKCLNFIIVLHFETEKGSPLYISLNFGGVQLFLLKSNSLILVS